MNTLPAICAELRLHGEDGVPLVNSRDVAETFPKRHADVLRDIAVLLEQNADLRPAWFRRTSYLGANGKTEPSYDLTRDGFTLLVMAWTGERAMAFKVRYIEAFNAMEAALRTQPSAIVSTDLLLSAVREIVAPLAVRHDTHDVAIHRVEQKVETLGADVIFIKANIIKGGGRRRPSLKTKDEHVRSIFALGRRCPCCGQVEVVNETGEKSRFAEFDHFYANNFPSVDYTWLICKPCHDDLSTGRVARHEREAEFRSYQQRRNRLPGKQRNLFGP